MGLKLSFLGGAGTVTGSKYAVEHEGHQVLVDCGLFQGFKALRLKNWAPFSIEPRSIEAVRHGDRDVEISVKNLTDLNGRTPVLVDDIISSGRTMIEAVRVILARGSTVPVCIAVHGLFADIPTRCSPKQEPAWSRRTAFFTRPMPSTLGKSWQTRLASLRRRIPELNPQPHR